MVSKRNPSLFVLPLLTVSVCACGGQLDSSPDDLSPSAQGGKLTNSGGTSGLGATTSLGGTVPWSTEGNDSSAPSTTTPSCTDWFVEQSNGDPFDGIITDYTDRVTPSCGDEDATRTPDFLVTLRNAAGYYVDTIGSDFDTVLTLYEGPCAEVELACDDDGAPGLSRSSQLYVPDNVGTFVTIAVTGYGTDTGHFTLHIGKADAFIAPPLPSQLDTTVSGSTRSSEDRYSSHCSTRVSSPDNLYTFTPPKTGVYEVTVDKSDFDPMLAIVQGNYHGTEILCLDDWAGELNPRVGYYLLAGQSYTIVVDSFGGSSGDYTMSIRFNPNDTGDYCTASDTRASSRDVAVADCVCKSWPNCCSEAWNDGCVLASSVLGCGDTCPNTR